MRKRQKEKMNQEKITKKRNNDNKNKSSIINCYLKWDDHAEEKSYLEKMHNEIINMPVKETSKSLHKFGHLGYLREETYNGESHVIKRLFSEAWSEEDNNDNNNKKEGYCKVSSDIIKARLPEGIKITMQREKLEDNKNKNNKNKITTRIGRQRQQQKQQEKQDSPIVKSLKDFVQLFEQKEKEGQNPRVYISYW
jgi:hypothetical protein